MPTVQELLKTIDTTYRNSYSTAQKVEWMDTVQRQIFQLVRHEAVPYVFQTQEGFSYYPLPLDCDPMGIKQVTIETSPGSGAYRDLKFVPVESNERLDASAEFYSIEANQNLFINPIPNAETEGRNIYVYYNKRPKSLSANNLSTIPDLEEDFHELLVLGTLERIARARGEIDDKNMFAGDFNMLLREYKNMYKQVKPEYTQMIDNLPRRRGQVHVKRRHSVPYSWIPGID
jgi:hypothetical protein